MEFTDIIDYIKRLWFRVKTNFPCRKCEYLKTCRKQNCEKLVTDNWTIFRIITNYYACPDCGNVLDIDEYNAYNTSVVCDVCEHTFSLRHAESNRTGLGR